MSKTHTSQAFLPAGAFDVDTGEISPGPQWSFMIAGDWGSIILRVNSRVAAWFPYPRDGATPDWDGVETWLMDSERRVRKALPGQLKGMPKDAFEHLQANWPTA